MKLISMTDFVLETFEEEIDCAVSEQKMYDYANFLKQPLSLGMFVPCDDDGIFLSKPPISEDDYEEDLIDAVIDKRYEIAQSKVIFKGFRLKGKSTIKNNWLEIMIMPFSKTNSKFYLTDFSVEKYKQVEIFTIEDLISYNLDLTVSL